jgi:hypothetical protein
MNTILTDGGLFEVSLAYFIDGFTPGFDGVSTPDSTRVADVV